MVGTALDRRGGVAAVLRTWRDAGVFERLNVRYVATNGPGGRVAKARQAIAAWARCAWAVVARRCDVVHVHTSSYASFWRKSPVFALALAAGVPLVVSLHGGAFRSFHAEGGRLRRAWIGCVLRRAAAFVVLTESWARWARAVEPRARVEVLPNVVPLPPVPDPGRVECDLLLALGRVEREKGIPVLIEALARANRRGAGWRLVCGGDGDLDGARALAACHGLGPQTVVLAGWLDAAAKDDWLARCALLVLPSLAENMPMAAIEAFAHARPVLASRVGGLPDMIDDGIDGWLVEPGDADALADALVLAAERRGALAAMGRAARVKAAGRYALGPVAARLAELYARAVSHGRRDAVERS